MRVAAEATCCDIYSFQGDVEVGLAKHRGRRLGRPGLRRPRPTRIDDMNITRFGHGAPAAVAVADMETDERAASSSAPEWRRFGYRSAS